MGRIVHLVTIAALGGQCAGPLVRGSDCPDGHIINVTHITKGRSQTAETQLAAWLASMEDRELAKRVAEAFRGGLCKGDSKLLTALQKMAKRSPADLRAESIWVLGFEGSTSAMETVRTALKDDAAGVKLKALSAISYNCDKLSLSAVQRLIRRERNPDVLRYAREVSEHLQGNPPCVPLSDVVDF